MGGDGHRPHVVTIGGMTTDFWRAVDYFVATTPVVIDRPKGSPDPNDTQCIYPLDYGYLEGTSSADCGGLDVWVGVLDDRRVVGFLCTVDIFKLNMEIKLLLGCAPADIIVIRAFYSSMHMGHTLVMRPGQ